MRRNSRIITWPLLISLLLLAGGCSLYNDYNLKGKYKLTGGEYYDGRMYPLPVYDGTMNLETTTYSMQYSVSFTKKDSSEITEARDESGQFNYTTEYETAVFGADGKVFTGYIFFKPPEGTADPWRMKYEFQKKHDLLILSNYRDYSQLGYYVILRWEKVK